MAAVFNEIRRHPIRAPWIFTFGIAVLVVALVTGYGLWLLAIAIAVPAALVLQARPQRGVIVFVALLPFDGMLRARPRMDEPVEASRDPRVVPGHLRV